MEGSGHALKQRCGDIGRQCESEMMCRAEGVTLWIKRLISQEWIWLAQHAAPERQLPDPGRFLSRSTVPFRPAAERGATYCQRRSLSRGDSAQGSGEVGNKYAPGYPIHSQMMDCEQETA